MNQYKTEGKKIKGCLTKERWKKRKEVRKSEGRKKDRKERKDQWNI